MKNLVFKLFLVIIFGVFMFSYAFPWSSYNIDIPFSGKDYKLGLDLQGGIELDYKIDLTEAKKEEGYNHSRESSIIEGLKSIIDKRIESLNINDSIITNSNYAGEQHIIVQIPLKGNSSLESNENIEKAKKAIGKVVKIEFKKVRKEITQKDLEERKQLAKDFIKEVKEDKYGFSIVAQKYRDSHENIIIGTTKNLEDFFSYSTGTFDSVENGINDNIFEVEDKDKGDGYLTISFNKNTLDYNFLFLTKKPSDWEKAMDSKGRVLNDKYFVKSSVQFNQAFQPMIELTFNNEGAEIFGELTKQLVGEQIAIFVGGQLLTAPNVNEPILSGKAVITGRYTSQEANKLSQDINTGVVPAPIYLTSERTIDSRLGSNSLSKLLFAGISGFLIILVFLLFVYRLSGFIASISLLIYIILVLALIKTFGVVLTLASIAGLILSIGMAIDANILIFERIKDELKSGNNLEKSIKIGFTKSWSAIWDSNVTGLIIAIILFIFGVNMIKGFGLMLAIGIIISLFSVMFISRIFISILGKTGIKKESFIGMKNKNN